MILSQWHFSLPLSPSVSGDTAVGTLRRPQTLNDYTLHQSLWKAFPAPSGTVRPFLFRSEQKTDGINVLVLSSTEPQKMNDVDLLRKVIFAPRFEKGARYRFFLRANPIKKLKAERCRVPLVSEKSLLQWLERKLEKKRTSSEY